MRIGLELIGMGLERIMGMALAFDIIGLVLNRSAMKTNSLLFSFSRFNLW
jgi:hypothetical protein